MITERRMILFPRIDLLEAMRAYGVKMKREFPAGAPESVQFDPTQDNALTIRYGRGAGNEDFQLKEVGAALIAYCRDNNIPLPKNAAKQVQKFKDGAALLVENKVFALHVMIIDDQDSMRSIIKKLLAREQIEKVTEAVSGVEALSMLANRIDIDPDVILCDLHMANMDGIEFLKRLRADQSNPHCRKPVLILTGDQNVKLHQATREAGASRVLTKPISAEDLAKEIKQALGYFDTGTPSAQA